MRLGDKQLGAPFVDFTGTTAAIEALTVDEGARAYATDTHLQGFYNGTSWVWGSLGQYRQFAWASDGLGGWQFISAGGEPVLHLQNLE